MADIAQEMRYKIDVKNGLVKQPMAGVLMLGDKNANRIIAELVDGDKTVTLDGMTVTGKFFRGGDGIDIPLDGAASGNEAIVLLDEHCYAVDGYFEASVKLTTGGATRTILTITGQVVSDGDGGILDIENVIPSVADIVAQYQSMQEVTAQTNAAMQKANEASERANTAAGDAEEKAIFADTAAKGASGWANATMTATALASGSAPTATVTTASDGHKVITLGIPRGNTGATPQISVEVQTGAAGSEASVSVSGTAENPVIHLTIPRGDTGAIENLTINGKPVESGTITIGIDDIPGLPEAIANAGGVKTVAGVSPDSAGNVALNAESVGALDASGTAADSSKLGGQNASYYKTTVMTAKGLLLNSDKSAIAGHGTAMIILHPGRIAEIIFSIMITTAPSSEEVNVFDFGLNTDILTSNYGVPIITPSEGGICRFIKDGAINEDMNAYAGTLQTHTQFWKPARMYDTSGSVGAWPTSKYAVGDRIEGVCYGTYQKE